MPGEADAPLFDKLLRDSVVVFHDQDRPVLFTWQTAALVRAAA